MAEQPKGHQPPNRLTQNLQLHKVLSNQAPFTLVLRNALQFVTITVSWTSLHRENHLWETMPVY